MRAGYWSRARTIWPMPDPTLTAVGTWSGVRLVRIIPERPYYAFVQLLLFLVSIKLVFDGLR